MHCYHSNYDSGYSAMMRDFTADDVISLNVQPKQAHYREHIHAMAKADQLGEVHTYTEKGIAKAIIGAQEYWKGRVAVWALVGDVTSWVRFHSETSKLLQAYSKANNVLRFELTTEADFDESERWAEMLGFKLESVMSNFGVDGKDHKMWVVLCQQQ